MITVDGLFVLDGKAQATGYGLGRKVVYGANLAAATAVTVDLSSATNGITPGDKIRSVRQIGYRITAGAAQTISAPVILFFVLGRGGVSDVVHEFGDSMSSLMSGSADGAGAVYPELVLMPGEYIYATASFSGAVAVNALQVWASCLEIPRGNFQH